MQKRVHVFDKAGEMEKSSDLWRGVRMSPADKQATRISSSAGRDRDRPRRAAARRDNRNRDGPTDRERQPRGASRACHLSSQPPRSEASVPGAPFKINSCA